MAHEKDKIRVKRQGKGRGAVTTDGEDEGIGQAATTLVWIKRRSKPNPSPGDDFDFPLTNAIVGLPPELFQLNTKKSDKDKVTMDYVGCSSPNASWRYTINVIDLPKDSDGDRILSDGSATIKNK